MEGLDAGNITRDAAISGITQSTGKPWAEVEKAYDDAMQLQGIVSIIAGYKVAGDEAAQGGKGTVKPDAAKGTSNQLVDGKWFDPNGLPLPVPPSVGAAGRVPTVLQTGGNTLNKSTANTLNSQLGESLTSREWGQALESLKKDNGLRNDFHGRILDNGNYIDDAGKVIGNIGDYLP
jgi:filamentous hemagglutinin